MEDARKKYAKMAKRFKLPKLENLEKVFAFKLSTDAENIYFDIIKGIEDSIIYARAVMENALFIDESSKWSQIYESRFVKRKELFGTYKKLMELKWKYRQIYFDTKDQECNCFIKDSYRMWTKEIKPAMLELCSEMEKAWKNFKKREREKQRYFG
jgi:hypothetical protein